MGSNKPKLPNMNEFSPGVVGDLRTLLEVVKTYQGDREGLKAAIAGAFPAIAHTPNLKQRLNRANNVLIGMSQCGLFDLKANQLTPFGARLGAEPEPAAVHDAFTKHILHDLHGFDLLG